LENPFVSFLFRLAFKAQWLARMTAHLPLRVKGAAKKRKIGLEPAAVAAVSQLELLAGSFIKVEAVDSQPFC
jgi:hypothetical protein